MRVAIALLVLWCASFIIIAVKRKTISDVIKVALRDVLNEPVRAYFFEVHPIQAKLLILLAVTVALTFAPFIALFASARDLLR